MDITANVHAALKDRYSPEAITKALKNLKPEAIAKDEHDRWTIDIWDKKSPINDVDAEHFLARDDVGDGEVYLLYRDGVLVFFQPHDPTQPGLVQMQQGHAMNIAREHVGRLAENAAMGEIINQVSESLDT